jgi:CheY-like chemotaxis protein
VNLNLRCSLLEQCGWHVLSAGNGHAGVTRFGQERVDAVAIDLNHDGSESALITAELKRQRPQVPVIILVANREVLVQGATQQADAVLLKCEEAQLLHDTLKNLLGCS